ncbi:MAG TPA: polyprenyl diphosphate synthase [Burkholderiaceae bacterium]|nr:polyprenyl diphosphate synthase [Burkholderiaceae bacterium]HQR76368.1 polyprenyl diphosphate synthase [Burkholderiaceae bacterium]
MANDLRSPPAALLRVPRHVAIIMDGNGRWALARGWPRVTGHSRGVDAVRATLGACGERGIEYLTLFAFSSENWRRPADEVSTLMRLFMVALQREVDKLVELGVRMRVVGETFAFDADLRRLIAQSEQRTAHNTRLHLTICANYGGRWDIAQAAERAAKEQLASGARNVRIDESAIAQRLSLSFAPEPDLLIRTGGERRISNFLLWQLAYAELYFSDVLWPDFNAAELESALRWYAGRQRRFGMTGEQIESEPSISDAA